MTNGGTMTGATEFTRRAGLAGLLSLAAGLVALAAYWPWGSGSSPSAFASDGEHALRSVLSMVVLLGCVTMVAGLAVRHRDTALVAAVRWVLPVGFLVAVVTGDVTAARATIGVVVLLVLLAVAVVGELPRAAAVLLIVSTMFDDALGPVAFVLSSVGWAWLAWAMWREPLPSPTPREGTAPA